MRNSGSISLAWRAISQPSTWAAQIYVGDERPIFAASTVKFFHGLLGRRRDINRILHCGGLRAQREGTLVLVVSAELPARRASRSKPAWRLLPERDCSRRGWPRATGPDSAPARACEDQVKPYVAKGVLVRVLDDWCAAFSGLHLYYPRHSPPAFSLLVEARCVVRKGRWPSARGAKRPWYASSRHPYLGLVTNGCFAPAPMRHSLRPVPGACRS